MDACDAIQHQIKYNVQLQYVNIHPRIAPNVPIYIKYREQSPMSHVGN